MRVNNTVPECLKDVKFERKLINVYKIHPKLDVQREIDMERAKYIGENWIENFNHDPIININTKTNEYEQPCGQHTVAGRIWRLENGLEDNATMWCRVATDLTSGQLNAIFAYEAIMSKPQSASSVLKALWEAGNECLKNISDVINGYGYTLMCNKNENLVVRCNQQLIDMNLKDLDSCFNLISYVFPRNLKINRKLVNTKAVEATFIKAVKLFLDVYGSDENYNIKKLKSAIESSETNASQLLKEKDKIEQHGNHPTRQLAYLIAKKYNDKVRKNKLKLSALDDYFYI